MHCQSCIAIVKDYGPLPPIVCLFLPSDSLSLLLDVAPLLSLVHVYGTIYLLLPSDITVTSSPGPSLLTFQQRIKCTYFVCSSCADCKLFFLLFGPEVAVRCLGRVSVKMRLTD